MSDLRTPARLVWDVLSGRASPNLPRDPELREQCIDLLRLHRLLGLWYVESGLSGSSDGDGSTEIYGALRGFYVQQALRTELTLEAADRARDALLAAGSPSLLFKGAALVRGGVYTDPGARMLGDADLLIEDGDVGGAIRALESVGFRAWVPWEESRKAWLPAFTFSDDTVPDGLDITVDLHWKVPYGSYRSGEEGKPSRLWEGADLERGLPAPEPHLLLIAEHFVGHLRVTPHLVGIADLVRLSAGDLDPERLAREARERGALRALRTLLAFLSGELEVPVAPQLLEVLRVPPTVTGWAARALAPGRLLAPPEQRKEGRVAGLLAESLAFGSIGQAFRGLLDVLHPPSDWLEHRYGSQPGGGLRRRLVYWKAVGLWAVGRGVSPLSPNQEFEDPRR